MNIKLHCMGIVTTFFMLSGSVSSLATTLEMPVNLEKSIDHICEKVKRFDTVGSFFSSKKNTLKNIVQKEYDLVTANKANIEDLLLNKYIFLGENHLDIDGMINNAILVRKLNRLAKSQKKSILLLMEATRFSKNPVNTRALAINSMLPRAIITYEKLTFDTQNFDAYQRPALRKILTDLSLNNSDKMDMDGWDNPQISGLGARNEVLASALNYYQSRYDHIIVIAGARHIYPSVVFEALSGSSSSEDSVMSSLASYYGGSDPFDASFSGYLKDQVENLDDDPEWDTTELEKSVRNHAPYLASVLGESHAVLFPRGIYAAYIKHQLSRGKEDSSPESLSYVREAVEKMDYFRDFMARVTTKVWKSGPEENILEDLALKQLLP